MFNRISLKKAASLFFLSMIFCLNLNARDNMTSDKDYLNYYRNNKSYNQIKSQGIKVVNLKEEESFFVYWTPKNYSSKRIIVLLHGTGGSPYDEIKDELKLAEKYDIMLIGIQWHNRRKKLYYRPKHVYRIIDKTLQFIKEKYNHPLAKIAYMGFSRGSAISYEIAYMDRQHKKYFDLFISHSGAIPDDMVVAPGESQSADPFFSDLTSGKLGNNVFKGINFILYAGKNDEQWGDKMYNYMKNTAIIIEENGGNVVKLILDEKGKHMDFKNNPEYHESGYLDFIKLTE